MTRKTSDKVAFYNLSAFPKEEREKVKYVTCDIWRPYIESAYRYLPNVTVALERLCKALHNESYEKCLFM